MHHWRPLPYLPHCNPRSVEKEVAGELNLWRWRLIVLIFKRVLFVKRPVTHKNLNKTFNPKPSLIKFMTVFIRETTHTVIFNMRSLPHSLKRLGEARVEQECTYYKALEDE